MVICTDMASHLTGVPRNGLNGTPRAAHGGVATPCNRLTIPRHRTLLCTPVDAPFKPFNYGFQVNPGCQFHLFTL